MAARALSGAETLQNIPLVKAQVAGRCNIVSWARSHPTTLPHFSAPSCLFCLKVAAKVPILVHFPFFPSCLSSLVASSPPPIARYFPSSCCDFLSFRDRTPTSSSRHHSVNSDNVRYLCQNAFNRRPASLNALTSDFRDLMI